jgi:hypothetical protein
MNRYAISGADKKTGADVHIEIEAASEADARTAALHKGVLITECKLLTEKKATVTDPTQPQLREILFWVRFIGFVTAVAVLAGILKLIMR